MASELEQLRQEAEQLKNQIRVRSCLFLVFCYQAYRSGASISAYSYIFLHSVVCLRVVCLSSVTLMHLG